MIFFNKKTIEELETAALAQVIRKNFELDPFYDPLHLYPQRTPLWAWASEY